MHEKIATRLQLGVLGQPSGVKKSTLAVLGVPREESGYSQADVSEHACISGAAVVAALIREAQDASLASRTENTTETMAELDAGRGSQRHSIGVREYSDEAYNAILRAGASLSPPRVLFWLEACTGTVFAQVRDALAPELSLHAWVQPFEAAPLESVAFNTWFPVPQHPGRLWLARGPRADGQPALVLCLEPVSADERVALVGADELEIDDAGHLGASVVCGDNDGADSIGDDEFLCELSGSGGDVATDVSSSAGSSPIATPA